GDKIGAATDRNAVALRSRGFMVAGINYSLAPAHPFPAQIQDLTCGVRFLRSKSAQYGIDPNRIGAMGVSAGGHLAAMLGVDNGSSMFVDGGYPHESSKVQAVAALWGVHDLTLHDRASYDEVQLPRIFGPKPRWASESPISYVRPGLPPF